MAFTISPSIQIERDADGAVRNLSHGGQPYGPLANILNAQMLAEIYLRDVAAIYGNNPTWLSVLRLSPSSVVRNAATELRFGQEEAITGTATVSVQQTYFGAPNWGGRPDGEHANDATSRDGVTEYIARGHRHSQTHARCQVWAGGERRRKISRRSESIARLVYNLEGKKSRSPRMRLEGQNLTRLRVRTMFVPGTLASLIKKSRQGG
jgi:hypothetical protein